MSIKNLNVDYETLSDVQKRDIHLRKLALGEIQGPPTNYATLDKPWLKWYTEQSIMSNPNSSSNVYDNFVLMAPEDIVLLEYYGTKYTKKDIMDKVEMFTKKFASMGIREKTTVSFMMLDVPEVLFMWMALSRLGAVANLIKFDEGPERIAFMNNIGEADYMFVSEVPFILKSVSDSFEYGNNVKQVVSIPITEEMSKDEMIKMITSGLDKENLTTKEKVKLLKEKVSEMMKMKKDSKDILKNNLRFKTYKSWFRSQRESNYSIAKDDPDRTSIIVYTGGTTGKAKGVELTNSNIANMAHMFKYSDIGFDSGKTSLNILPPGPAYYLNGTYALLCCGVRVYMISNFEIKEYSSLIDKYKPNIFLSGPILLKQMAEDGVIQDASYITAPISGGDKLHTIEEEKINEFFKKHNSNAIVHQGYGESESTAAATYSKDSAAVVGGIGIPLLNVEVGIFDYVEASDFIPGKEVEKHLGEIGEICIAGPTIMKGYKNNPEETKNVLRLHSDGKYWLHTDDLGYLDADGRLFHCGRAKRMITRSGSKVWLGTLEDVIKRSDFIRDCCCVKFDDSEEREIPVAFIIPNADFNDEAAMAIDEMVKKAQPDTYVPKYYVIVDEIPITEVNQKVDFKKLEKTDIFDSDKYEINGKIIKIRKKVFKKEI